MVKNFRVIRYFLTTATLLMLVNSVSYAANIEATIDRTTVQENESVSLKYSSDSEVDDDPDFSPIENDFRILNRSQSSNISIINGRVNREITWQLMLMPRRSGRLVIPAIAFGRDRSNALSIKVVPVTAGSTDKGIGDELVYIDAEVDNQSVYVQSQLVYTLRIYHAVQLRNASLSDLEINDNDAMIERLSENRNYDKILNGRRYRVIEKQYAIFPQTVGELVIEPAVLEAQYIDLPRVLRTKRVVSDRVKVEVKAVPEEARQTQSNYWLPARSLTLTEQWSDNKKEIKVGEPVTRTLTAKASGLLSSQLPELSSIAGIGTVKQYADQPVLENEVRDDGFTGSRQEKIAYIPSKAGELKLPAITLNWWDTENNQLQTASVPERIIKVTGVAAQVPQPGKPQIDTANNKQVKESSGNQGKPPAIDAIAGISSQIWFGLSVALAVLWLLTLTGWYVSARKRGEKSTAIESDSSETLSPRTSFKTIKSACDSNDPQQAKAALIKWAHQQWPEHPPNSVGHVAQRVNGALSDELQRLNNVLYKPGVEQWNGTALWQALQNFSQHQKNSPKHEHTGIAPLYRLANINEDK